VPELHLSFPVHPVRVNFAESQELGFGERPLDLFRFEAVWLAAPHLELLSATSAERDFELDCRLTCEPVIKRTLDLEARLPLPELAVVPTGSYAFLRMGSFRTSQNARPVQELRAGLGGFLSF
jgi:hypothetical protein